MQGRDCGLCRIQAVHYSDHTLPVGSSRPAHDVSVPAICVASSWLSGPHLVWSATHLLCTHMLCRVLTTSACHTASYNIVESKFGIYGQLVIVCCISTVCLRGTAGQLSHGLAQINVWWRISHANIYPRQALQVSTCLIRLLHAGTRRCASHHLHRRD